MDVQGSFGVLRRRKGLTSTLLLLTLAGTAGAGIALPWTYSASTTEVLLNSASASTALGGGNPFLSFNSTLVDMANVLALKISDTQNLAALKAQGDTASFTTQVLSENAQTQEPFIQISVTGKSKAAVSQTLQDVTANLDKQLAQLQTGVTAKNKATLQVIANDSTPTRSSSAKLKPLVGFLGVGLILTFLIPQAVEGARTRRRPQYRRSDVPAREDRPQPREMAQREPDPYDRGGRPAPTRNDAHPQWIDRQANEDLPGQRVSPGRNGRPGPPRPEYGDQDLDGGYPMEQRRW